MNRGKIINYKELKVSLENFVFSNSLILVLTLLMKDLHKQTFLTQADEREVQNILNFAEQQNLLEF